MHIINSIFEVLRFFLKYSIEICGALLLALGCLAAVKNYLKLVQVLFKNYNSNIEVGLGLLGYLLILRLYFAVLYKLFGLSSFSYMD
jgi:hypothetical protein